MARARNIKPGFFKNEEVASCSPMGRLLFVGLWTLADRDGRLEDRPKRIQAELFALDKCDVDELLQELADHNLIVRYKANGSACIAIPTFRKHQKTHPNEGSTGLPAPDGSVEHISSKKWTYFVQAGENGPIKIGAATNPKWRLDELQIANAETLRIVGISDQPERQVQKLFKSYRIRNEWFKPTPELLNYISTQAMSLDEFEELSEFGPSSSDKTDSCLADRNMQDSGLSKVPECGMLNDECGGAAPPKVETSPRPATEFKGSAEDLAQRFADKYRGTYKQHKLASDTTPGFAELLRLGVKPAAILAEIEHPKRDRTEFFNDLKKRLLGPPGRAPALPTTPSVIPDRAVTRTMLDPFKKTKTAS